MTRPHSLLAWCLLLLASPALAAPANHTPAQPKSEIGAASATSVAPASPTDESAIPTRILRAAEAYLGEPYAFGGRMGRPGCRDAGKRVACAEGIDCLSLLFFAYEAVLGTPWYRFSVTPTESVARQELGVPVPGLNGVLREALNPHELEPGDVLYFLLEGYNLEADGPLFSSGDRAYGTWHTGFFHSHVGGEHRVLHAAPGAQVRIDPITQIAFDAVVVVRHGGS